MLLICPAKVSPRCIKVRSAHNRSAATKESICPFCAEELAKHPELKQDTLQSILKGKDNGRTRRA